MTTLRKLPTMAPRAAASQIIRCECYPCPLFGRRMGSGGPRGLQNRCFGAEASKGWFDSDPPPPARPGIATLWTAAAPAAALKAAQPPRRGFAAAFESGSWRCRSPELALWCVGEEAYLLRSGGVRDVHGLDGSFELEVVLGVDEDYALVRGTGEHLPRDHV